MKDIKNIIIAIIVLSVIIISFWLWVKPKKKPSVIPAINKQLEEMEAVKKEEIENRNKIIKDLENQISIIKAKRNKKPIMRIKTPKEKQELINNLNDKGY